MDYESQLAELRGYMRETALLETTQALLEWDERTMLPPAGGEFRADQITLLSGLIHRRHTDSRVDQWLSALAESPLAADPHSDSGATIRLLRRDYDKRRKLPVDLVERMSRATVLGQQHWVKARHDDNFRAFAPSLQEIVALKREQAQAIGYAEHPYDALLDDYEPDARTSAVTRVLAALREELAPFVAAIAASSRRPDCDILKRSFPVAAQEAFGKQAAAAIGFDFQRGRLDVTHHPFCTGLGPNDCRITTRYDEHYFPQALFGILHEAGHGIYDQGLRREHHGLPPGAFVSLGIHESQSRMWENLVGRSHAFWRHFYPKLVATFPDSLRDVTLDAFFFAINGVRPSLIRVEADEATYNLHIIVRFELEQALLTGDLVVDDLPSAWREAYRKYLGIEPPDDASGVLQDIHWSAGLIGYFPTYSLGNLYSSQLFEAAERDLGSLADQFARGEFQPLREWLNRHVHSPGRCYAAADLARRVTGQELSHGPLMRHLRGKLGPLYGV